MKVSFVVNIFHFEIKAIFSHVNLWALV
jgi:hypothetical protein